MQYKKKTKRVEIECTNCKKLFLYKVYDLGKYKSNCCSRKCSNELKITSSEVECKQCGKKFNKIKSQIIKFPNHFCSQSCAASFNNTHKDYGIRRSKLEIYLEEYIRKTFPQIELFCNNKESINSELDFYFPSLKFAIELNGIVHYEPIYGVDKFEKIQNNDKRKAIACYEKGIELAIIDTSNCKYLSNTTKEKYSKIVCDLLEEVISKNISG